LGENSNNREPRERLKLGGSAPEERGGNPPKCGQKRVVASVPLKGRKDIFHKGGVSWGGPELCGKSLGERGREGTDIKIERGFVWHRTTKRADAVEFEKAKSADRIRLRMEGTGGVGGYSWKSVGQSVAGVKNL